VATVGGDPEIVVPKIPPSRLTSFSPDNQRWRTSIRATKAATASDQFSAHRRAQALPSDPYASKDVYNQPKLKFSPDGKQILLLMNGGRQHEEAWLLPYPPSGKASAPGVSQSAILRRHAGLLLDAGFPPRVALAGRRE